MSPTGASIKRIAVDALKVSLLAVIFTMALKSSVVEANQVVSGSMEPTLRQGDFVLVNKTSYGLRLPFISKMLWQWSNPKRGDIVTFAPPKTMRGAKERLFIKRIVALPGDRVEVKDATLYINGEAVLESDNKRPYLQENLNGKKYQIFMKKAPPAFGPYDIPKDYVFVVGDNRANSHDSRSWGPLPMKNIEGKAWVIYFANSPLGNGLRRIGTLL